MADDQTQTVDPNDQQAALVQQLLRQTLTGTAAQAPEPPHSGDNRTWGSLLGQALVGGAGPGSTDAQNEQAGLRALQQVGLGMMSGSDYSQQRHSLGSIIANAVGGAQESNAAQIGAQQEYAQKAQEMQLARVKEALPLLTMLQTLQQQKALRGMPSSLGGTPTTIGAAGTGGIGAVGAPLPTEKGPALTAIAQRESGGNPAALNYVAKADPTAYDRGATASGKYQIVNSTWREGMQLAGLDPSKYATARDAPESVQDQVAGAIWDKYGNKPWQKGGTDWVKGSDGRYALQPVAPGAPAASTDAQALPVPPIPPAQPPGVSGTPLPAGRPTGPPIITDQPVGSATVAGPPGTATVGQPLPPSPAVAGNVNAIIGGMTGAGASPTTLAPGSAVPGPQITTQASTQPQAPPAVETTPPAPAPTLAAGPPTFTYTRHDPPPGMLQGSKLTSEEQSVVQDARNAYQNAIRVAITPEQRQQAEATLQATLDKELTARAGRTDAAAKQMADWYANDFKQQQEQHKLTLDNYYKNQDQQQQLQNQLKLEAEKGAQSRLTNKEAVFNQANQKGLETAQTEQISARNSVAQLESFRSVSDAVKQPNWLQTTKWPGSNHSIAEQLQQAGIPVEDTGGVQLLQGAMTNLTRTLREGMPMGALSDRDLDFIQRMGPTEWMDKDTRRAAVDYLQRAFRSKQRFASDVQKEMSRGKNFGDAVDTADAKQPKSFVPTVDADLSSHWTDNSKEWTDRRIKWAQDNDVRPGTLFHMNNGNIVIWKSKQEQK